MNCPKDRKTPLEDGMLSGDLPVRCCPGCKGTWIPPEAYETWQQKQEPRYVSPQSLATLEVDYIQSSADLRAGLCPTCNRYLARAKVNLQTPFFVERCPNCGGIWCDRGEWEVLERIGLHAAIEQLFASEWQEQVRQAQHEEKEKAATTEKLGQELAGEVFDLAAKLEKHPNGDFGVAYLMRRFDKR